MMSAVDPKVRPWTGPTTGTGKRRAILAVALVAGLLGTGCDESDVAPPEGSTVTLVANPATLVVVGAQVPESDLSALVTNSIGVALPGQTVRFSTSAGELIPEALTPIETGPDGIARTKLRTVRTATIDAFSGAATATLTISILTGNIQTIVMNGDTNLTSCDFVLRFNATVFDDKGETIPGVTLVFELRNGTGAPGTVGDWAGIFTPTQALTDSNGEVADIRLTPNVNDCLDKCSNKTCQATVVAVDQSGLFASPPLIILDAVP